MLGRLVSEVGGYSRYYTYDAAGNRTQAIVDTSTTICYTYDSDGRLVSEISNNGSSLLTTSYVYDSNGSLISENDGDVTTYAYDVWGNMTSAGNASYAYNAQGLRVSKTVNGSTDSFVLVGGDVWADSESTYLRGLELISSSDYFYLYNIRGDVIQLLDYDGEVVKTYDYDAYGNELSRDLADENPFRYCGEYYDTETGLIYLRARYYDPNIGRFTSKDIHWNPYNSIYGDDPDSTAPDNSAIIQSSNLYVYCGGDPVNRQDYSGAFWHLVIGAVAGAAISTVISIGTAIIKKEKIDLVDVGISAVAGAASGVLAATGVGLFGAIVGNATISMAESVATQVKDNNGLENFSVTDMLIDGVIGGVAGAIGGNGSGSKHMTKLGTQTIKRTVNSLVNKGIKEGIKEAGKAFTYYVKNTVKYYKDFAKGLLKDTISSIATTLITGKNIKEIYRNVMEVVV